MNHFLFAEIFDFPNNIDLLTVLNEKELPLSASSIAVILQCLLYFIMDCISQAVG